MQEREKTTESEKEGADAAPEIVAPAPATGPAPDAWKSSGFERQDTYADLSLLDVALSLALELPPWAPEEPIKSDLKRKEFLGESFPVLRDLVDRKWHHFSRLCSMYRSARLKPGDMVEYFLLNPDQWAASTKHAEKRLQLIDLLLHLRGGVLDSLRVVQSPRARPVRVTRWDDLPKRQQDIVRVVAEKPREGKAIATALGRAWENIKRDLAALTRLEVLHCIPKKEYRVLRVPEGAPPDLFASKAQARTPDKTS